MSPKAEALLGKTLAMVVILPRVDKGVGAQSAVGEDVDFVETAGFGAVGGLGKAVGIRRSSRTNALVNVGTLSQSLKLQMLRQYSEIRCMSAPAINTF
jgi:hypothetical protein